MNHDLLPPCVCGKNCPLPWYQQVIVWLGWMDFPYWRSDAQLEAMEGNE